MPSLGGFRCDQFPAPESSRDRLIVSLISVAIGLPTKVCNCSPRPWGRKSPFPPCVRPGRLQQAVSPTSNP